MEHFKPQITFDTSSNLNLNTFTNGRLTSLQISNVDQNEKINLLKKFSEKIGRGLNTNNINYTRNQITLNGNTYNDDDWIKQLEYDQFMNEIWIGVVLTLVVISFVFCICSCFLYHQFRKWKRSYHRDLEQAIDIESTKLNFDNDDDDESLPSYTLVSGLPTYDAAIEQLKNIPNNNNNNNKCLVFHHPTIFRVFALNENENLVNTKNDELLKLKTNDLVPSYEEAISTIIELKETVKNNKNEQEIDIKEIKSIN